MEIISLLLMLQLHLIPSKYLEFGNLYKYINPSDTIVWWEAGLCDLATKRYKPIFCSDTSIKINFTEFSNENTYSSNFYTVFPGQYYLVYKTLNGDLRYINKVEQLISFLGVIDNLPEALFLAHMYGFSAKPNRKFGSFCFSNEVYILNLYKITRPPDDLLYNEKLLKAKIKVDSSGNVFEFIGKKNVKWRKLTEKDMYRH